jgi:hypothetical protein
MQMKPLDFAAILERVKAATQDQETKIKVDWLQQKMMQEEVDDVDLTLLGIKADPDGKFPDDATDIIEQVIAEPSKSVLVNNETVEEKPKIKVSTETSSLTSNSKSSTIK